MFHRTKLISLRGEGEEGTLDSQVSRHLSEERRKWNDSATIHRGGGGGGGGGGENIFSKLFEFSF